MKIFLCITIFILFIIWTNLLIKEKLTNIDKLIYNKIKFSDRKTIFFKILTNLADTKYFIIICALIILFLPSKKIAIIISIAMIITAILVGINKHLIKRERPKIKRLVEEKGYSYPSGHTFSATCFYGLIIYLTYLWDIDITFKIIISIFLSFLIVMIGKSRIYLGVHYFSDIIGGLLLSLSYIFLYVYLVSDILNLL